MPIGNEMETLVALLELHPVFQGAHHVSQMELSGGTHPAGNSRSDWL